MSIFRFRWLRKFVRRHTNPIPESRAALWKQRLSVAYAVLAWNGFGVVCYLIFTGRSDWVKYYGLKTDEDENLSAGHQWAKILNVRNAQVYRVDGLSFKKVDEDIQEDVNVNK